MAKPIRIAVIPDTQVKPGVRIDHLEWAGKYIAEKKPDVVIHLGDHWDMPSLSSYDKGKASAEGRRVNKDIEAGNKALELLTRNMKIGPQYSPKLLILRGNHENRILRAIDDDPKLEGTIGYHLFNDVALGWKPVPFLQPVVISGVSFCHYFPRSGDGNIAQTKRGAPSARAQLMREMQSCVSGHKQGLDLAIHTNGTKIIRSIIAGSFYQHKEEYLSPQGNSHWQGILFLQEVHNGSFNIMEVGMEYLRRKYGKKTR